MKIRDLFRKYEELEKITSSYEDDETKEEEWGKAYEKEFAAYSELATEIMNLIKVDRKTANEMIVTKRNELRNLINRIA